MADIREIPLIPEGLREAATAGRLIPFVGAGVSRIAGCPNWDGFAEQITQQLVQKGALNQAEVDLNRKLNARTRLSIAKILAARHRITLDHDAAIHPRKDWRTHENGARIYRALQRLANRFVTTNYDYWLDAWTPAAPANVAEQSDARADAHQRAWQVFHKRDDLLPSNLAMPGSVIHLHGSLASPDDMVVSTRDYLRHYSPEAGGGENRVLTFLEHLFSKKCVLFVGYGLEELEVLEYVILKSKQRGLEAPRHYILQGFFKHEMFLCDSLGSYFADQCGIELIPYSRDLRDWDQLIPVLEDFASRLPASDPMLLEDFVDMEAFLNG